MKLDYQVVAVGSAPTGIIDGCFDEGPWLLDATFKR